MEKCVWCEQLQIDTNFGSVEEARAHVLLHVSLFPRLGNSNYNFVVRRIFPNTFENIPEEAEEESEME
jgi:hypothetical protein